MSCGPVQHDHDEKLSSSLQKRNMVSKSVPHSHQYQSNRQGLEQVYQQAPREHLLVDLMKRQQTYTWRLFQLVSKAAKAFYAQNLFRGDWVNLISSFWTYKEGGAPHFPEGGAHS